MVEATIFDYTKTQNDMKISKVIFQGREGDRNTYQLALKKYNDTGLLTVIVLRNFRGDQAKQDQVPSGWFYHQVINSTILTIDGGQGWVVYPTKEAWADLKSLLVSPNHNGTF